MHRCFGILEVLRNVVEHVGADKEHGSRTLVALSTTCKMFHDAAQDVIWRNQTGLLPLLRCLPQVVWDDEAFLEMKVFVRCPSFKCTFSVFI